MCWHRAVGNSPTEKIFAARAISTSVFLDEVTPERLDSAIPISGVLWQLRASCGRQRVLSQLRAAEVVTHDDSTTRQRLFRRGGTLFSYRRTHSFRSLLLVAAYTAIGPRSSPATAGNPYDAINPVVLGRSPSRSDTTAGRFRHEPGRLPCKPSGVGFAHPLHCALRSCAPAV